VGTRPALVISATIFSRGPADLVVVLPVTTRERGIPLHVRIEPPEGGVRETSFVQCEDIRSVSRERLIERWGAVFPETLARTEGALRVLLEL
jgi:mRNA interferase MazF